MTSSRSPAIAWIAGLTAYLLVRAFWLVSDQRWLFLYETWADGVLKFGLWVVVPVAGLALTGRGTAAIARALRLTRSPGAGLTFGLLATLPMAAALFVSPPRAWNAGAIAGHAVLGPVAEEVLFRGVLFLGLRAAGWRLWSALTASAVAFALAHEPAVDSRLVGTLVSLGLGRGPELLLNLAVDVGLRGAMLAAGGVLFGWLVHRFDSLWPAIGLHAFINLWWQLHLGPALPFATAIDWMTAAHGLSVVLAVVLALRWTRPARPQSSMNQSSILNQSSITDHQSSM